MTAAEHLHVCGRRYSQNNNASTDACLKRLLLLLSLFCYHVVQISHSTVSVRKLNILLALSLVMDRLLASHSFRIAFYTPDYCLLHLTTLIHFNYCSHFYFIKPGNFETVSHL